jgi:DNA-binding NarL/FixJ family response regulator
MVPMPAPPLRVTVADDFDGMRELLAAALEATGRFEVVARCSSGEEALAAVRELQPDLALLDLGMPGTGGIDALPKLVEASPDTRVVVVSGFPRGRLAHLTLGHGAVGYVEKSLSPRAMVNDIVAVAGLLETVTLALDALRTRLERDPRSSAAARRFVGEALRTWECEDLLDTVNLLVSELVTNSVLHANSAPDVAVLLKPDVVRIEVTDESGALPTVRGASEEAISGRGLALVESLASRWGVEVADVGKTVWFEVERPDSAALRVTPLRST